jgi:drug/metabolite transporter (DMT)-like permease
LSHRHRSIITLLFVMAIWGSTFVVTKAAIAELPPLTLAFARVAIGSLVLTPFAWLRYRRSASPGLPWRALAVLGLVGVALYYVAFNLSLQYTSATQGALVQSCIPAMTALIAVLWFGERASRTRILGIALSVVGVLIVFSGNSDQTNHPGNASDVLLGNLLMFATAAAWGLYTSLAKRVAAFDPVVTTTCITGIGAVLLLPAALFELAGRELPAPSTSAWLSVLYLGALASGAAYMLYNNALRHMDASEVGVYTNLIPVVGVIAGLVLLHDPLSMRAVIGGLVVMAGVWITGSERRT